MPANIVSAFTGLFLSCTCIYMYIHTSFVHMYVQSCGLNLNEKFIYTSPKSIYQTNCVLLGLVRFTC